MTYEEKFYIASKALPGTADDVTTKCPFSRGTVDDVLRRMKGLGLVTDKEIKGKLKHWALTRDGEQLRDVRTRMLSK